MIFVNGEKYKWYFAMKTSIQNFRADTKAKTGFISKCGTEDRMFSLADYERFEYVCILSVSSDLKSDQSLTTVYCTSNLAIIFTPQFAA